VTHFDILSRLFPARTEKNNEQRILSDKVDDIRGVILNWGLPITKPTWQTLRYDCGYRCENLN